MTRNCNFIKINNILTDFFEEINYIICPRCSPKQWTQESAHLSMTDVKKLPKNLPKEWGHHMGDINKILKSNKKINKSWIDKFYYDTEHGFFHGLMTSFIMYLINLNSNNPIELRPKHYASTILHDFLKSNGISQEKHDKELINYFDKLLDETYTHSNPPDKYKNTLLVKADRIELRRYGDYKSWVDERYYNSIASLSNKTQTYLNIFYNNIRPALLYLYSNKNDIFIRHGIEQMNDRDFPITHWPIKFFNSFKSHLNEIYPIEIDRLPFTNNTMSKTQDGYCSNHEQYHSWNRIKGYISTKNFKKLNGKIIIPHNRDHLYATNKIEICNWIFIVQNLLSTEINDGISNDKLMKLYNTLLKTDNKIICQKSVFSFNKLIKLFCDRLLIINY